MYLIGNLFVEVWGDYALFTRPEMKVERVSYDVITPSAARGILEAIYWHPGLKYEIDKIFVMNKIIFENIRRNEVSQKISARNVKDFMTNQKGEIYLATSENISQRAAMVLKNVRYVIEAHMIITKGANNSDSLGKFYDIFMRRLENGQCYGTPCLGVREFPANFRLYKKNCIKTAYENETKDLGFMLYDMDYSDKENICPMFFRAVMENGIINVKNPEVFK